MNALRARLMACRALLRALLLGLTLAAGAVPDDAIAGRTQPKYLTPDGAIRVVGYNDMDEMLEALAARYRVLHPEIRFALVLNGTRTAPPALINGSSAFAPMGAELRDADRRAYAAAWGGEPAEIRVAHDSLKPGALSSPTGVFVAAGNPLEEISLSDLQRLFAAGEGSDAIESWGELGLGGSWERSPVHTVGLGSGTAIGAFILRHVLHSSAFAPSYRGFLQSRAAAAAIGHDRFSVGFANLSHAHPGIRALTLVDVSGRRSRASPEEIRSGCYPLDRFLLIYARRTRAGAVEPLAAAFLRFTLSAEGQEIIAKGSKGYLPLSQLERRHELEKLGARLDRGGSPPAKRRTEVQQR